MSGTSKAEWSDARCERFWVVLCEFVTWEKLRTRSGRAKLTIYAEQRDSLAHVVLAGG
jgi:hypothetical protein